MTDHQDAKARLDRLVARTEGSGRGTIGRRHPMMAGLLLLGLLLAGCSTPAATPTSFTCPAGSDTIKAAAGLVGTADGEAKEIFLTVRNTESAAADKACAAQGLAAIANEKTAKNWAQQQSGKWNDFFASWISPVINFGVPLLVIFVLLLALSRLLTGLVPADAHDFESPGRASTGYWSGIAGLAVSATVLTAGWSRLPWSRTMSLVALSLWGAWMLWVLVNNLVGAEKSLWKMRAGNRAAGSVLWFEVALLVPVVTVAVLLVTRGPSVGLLLVPAVTLAVVSAWQVALIRGLHLGLVIDGRKADGSSDGGASQLIMQRLAAIGGGAPRGLVTAAQPDVDALSADAIALLPTGTILQKAMTFCWQQFSPSTPWRATVSHLDDSTVEVDLTRNGRSVATEVITPSTVGLPRPAVDAVPDPKAAPPDSGKLMAAQRQWCSGTCRADTRR